jgi:hypothetical protein
LSDDHHTKSNTTDHVLALGIDGQSGPRDIVPVEDIDQDRVKHVSELLDYTPDDDMVDLQESSEAPKPLPNTFGDPDFKSRLDALCMEYNGAYTQNRRLYPPWRSMSIRLNGNRLRIVLRHDPNLTSKVKRLLDK